MEEEFFDDSLYVEGGKKKRRMFNNNTNKKRLVEIRQQKLANFKRPAYSYTSICADEKFRISVPLKNHI